MAIRKILKYPEDERLLRKKSVRVEKIDRPTRQLVQDLKDTLEHVGGAGLAAPQIGVHQRVAIVRFGQDEGEMQPPTALINPRIKPSGLLKKGFDGCLSIPEIVTWDTLRPYSLVLSARDEKGKRIEMEVRGIDARVVHHEIDHLDGVLFLDRVQDLSEVYRVIQTEEGEKFVSLASLKPLTPA